MRVRVSSWVMVRVIDSGLVLRCKVIGLLGSG